MRSFAHWTPRYFYNRLACWHYQRRHPENPWLTPDAVDALAAWLQPSDVGFEWGCGRSTVWLARRVKKITSVEHDITWYQRVQDRLRTMHIENVELMQRELSGEEKSAYVQAIESCADNSLDFVLVDGRLRNHCTRAAMNKLRSGGLLILDNANVYLPCNSRAPDSLKSSPTPDWQAVNERLAGWRRVWTTNGLWDTVIFAKPDPERRQDDRGLGLSMNMLDPNFRKRPDMPPSLLLRLFGLASRIAPRACIGPLYRWSFLSNLIRTRLNALAPTELTEVNAESAMLRGIRLRLDLQSEKSYWLGTHELDVLRCISEFVKPGMTIYDVGANIGYMSLVFAHKVGESGHVFAFEPLPANAQRIRQHLSLNSLHHIVSINQKAVSDHNGKEKFFVHKSHAMGKLAGSAGRNAEYGEELTVDAVTLDDIVFKTGNPPPDLIKIDIEGGCVRALPGMTRILGQCHPILLMELHGPEESKMAWDMLKRNGYKTCRIQRGYPEILSPTDFLWKDHIIASPGKAP